MRPVIRRALGDDAEAIGALISRTVRHSNSVDYPAEVLDLIVAQHSREHVERMIVTRTMFVAMDADVLVGTGALADDQLRGLFVAPDRQGCGIGARLVAHVEGHAKNLGLSEIWLQASITAHPFYRKLGYRDLRFEERQDGSVTIMRKSLRT